MILDTFLRGHVLSDDHIDHIKNLEVEVTQLRVEGSHFVVKRDLGQERNAAGDKVDV